MCSRYAFVTLIGPMFIIVKEWQTTSKKYKLLESWLRDRSPAEPSQAPIRLRYAVKDVYEGVQDHM